MEGAGGYGAGLARHLAAGEEMVVELDRPKRPTRRAGAKSDPIDAERAARRAAVEAASAAHRQLVAMVITSPEPVRARFRGQTTRAMITTAAGLRPGASKADVEVLTALTVLRELARRIRFLEAEALGHERAIRAIVRTWRPDLLELTGVGPIVAATVLTAWSHPVRCRDDAAFAMLAGTAPIPASSGRTDREIKRCLKRYIARELYRRLESPPAAA
jgi:transposase